MSQHDLDIANQLFPATRTDLNNALQALGSTSSGTSAPSTTYANQLWYDTSNNFLYIRNEDNDANILIAELDQTNDTVEYFKSDSVRTALIEFTDGDDAITIADGGAVTTATDATVTGNLSLGGSNTELRFMEGSNYVGFEAPALTGNQIWVLLIRLFKQMAQATYPLLLQQQVRQVVEQTKYFLKIQEQSQQIIQSLVVSQLIVWVQSPSAPALPLRYHQTRG